MSPARPDAAPAVKPIEMSADLKALMRRLKLGKLLDILPDRLALAFTYRLPHHDFLELLFADEVTRRDRESATRRAKLHTSILRCSSKPGTTPPPCILISSCGPS